MSSAVNNVPVVSRTDGTLVIPEVDLSLLENNDQITVNSLPDIGGGNLTSEHIADNDAIILMLERIDKNSFTANQPLTAIARYGVGYDTIDTQACSANSVALAIAPDGVRRPVATTVDCTRPIRRSSDSKIIKRGAGRT